MRSRPIGKALPANRAKQPRVPRQTEVQVLAMIDASVDCVILINAAGEIVEFNGPAERTLGHRRDGVVGKLLIDTIIPPGVREHHRHGIASLMQIGNGQTLGNKVEVPAMCADGSEFPAELTVTKIKETDPPIFTACLRDITVRKAALNDLGRVRRQQELILQSMGEGVKVLNLQGEIVFVNAASAQMLGWDAAELVGRNAHTTIHHTRGDGKPYPWETCPICGTLRDGQSHRVDNEIFWRKDDSSFPVEYVNAPFRDENGEVLGAVVTFTDVSERVAASAKHQALERQSQLLFKTNPSPMWVYDANSLKFLAVNQAAVSHYGYSREEFLSRTIRDLSPAEDLPRFADPPASVSPSSNGGYWRHVKKDGRTIVASVFSSAIAFENTEARMAIAFDVTERADNERKVVESEANLALAQRIAHVGSWQQEITSEGILDGDSLRWSAEACRIFGEENGDCHPSVEQFYRALPSEDRDRVRGALKAMLETGKRYSIDYRIALADGARRIVHEEGEIIRDNGNGQRDKIIRTVHDITEQKLAEEALRCSEERTRAMIENGPEGVQTVSIDGRLLDMNPAGLRMIEATAAEVFGRQVIDLIHPEDRAAYLRVHEGASRGETGQVEFQSIGLKGTVRWMETHSVPLHGADGITASVLSVTRDISERKRAEEKHRAQERQYRLLFETNPTPMWVYDLLSLEFLAVNEAAISHYGYSREEFLSRTLSDIRPPEDVPALIETFSDLKAGGPQGRLWRHLKKDGSCILASIFSSPIVFEKRDAEMIIAFDVTEREDAARKVLESEQQNRKQAKLLDLAHDAIMVRDMKDRIEFWNHGAEILYGWSAEEVMGREARHFLYQEDPIASAADEKVLLETGKWTGESKHLRKDGGTVLVRSRWTLVRDENGEPKSRLIINTDITEQKKIEEQFLRAQRLESIGTLASGVAHDLNNILVPILMATPLLRGNLPAEERDKFLDIVEQSAERGASIVKQVVTFARGADGERILLQPIYLIEEMAKIAHETFPKSISFRTRYPENLRMLEADPTQLHQILLNLCVNARDAMPHGGALTLIAENFDVDEHYASMTPGAKPGPHVMLQVTDTGTGIPPDLIDKIFDPFFTTKVIGAGTGLGLSTVAGIVKSHGGFVNVYSEARYTSFKIFLPAVLTGEVAITADEPGMLPGGHGEVILIVDDEPSIRAVAKALLIKHGYQAIVAEGGIEALAIFARRSSEVAVVLIDIAMPVMDGLTLVRTLRKMEAGIKVILSTGRDEGGETPETKGLGINAYLTKPYTREKLLVTLDRLLNATSATVSGKTTL